MKLGLTGKVYNDNSMKVTNSESNEGAIVTYHSNAKTVSSLIADLEIVLEKLNSKELIKNEQVLFYIDGTNGHIFITGFDASTGDVYDDQGIWIELQELIDEKAMVFDEYVIESIREALNTRVGKRTTAMFEVYYQTNVDDPERIYLN